MNPIRTARPARAADASARAPVLALAAFVAALAACDKPAAPPASTTGTHAVTSADKGSTAPTSAAIPAKAKAPELAEAEIAWRQAASDAEVDAAYAVARSENKPVFVYWGAKWCPPCNQVKATLFNRQDFIARSRAF
ncbi:MAG: thioredoxin family protein, partial [Caldimonas sp.]